MRLRPRGGGYRRIGEEREEVTEEVGVWRRTTDSLIYMQIHFHKMAAVHFALSQRAGEKSETVGQRRARTKNK